MVIMKDLFASQYNGKKVIVTGNSGFKGSWLCAWLQLMGAEVLGYSIDRPSEICHFDLIASDYETVWGDIRDQKSLEETFQRFQPEIVFHMAAQALVRDSYVDPVLTYDTNVMGSLKVFEACRKTVSVKAIINVTSDKCYENREWAWGYRENEPMGGYDPYSSSKGCAELLCNSYRNSFFNLNDYGIKHNCLMASCRAGNVIGGGDWAKDRLIPDAVKAAAKGEIVEIRSPNATRPWQHVLEPLSGYLQVGQKLLEGNVDCAQGWNFGPVDDGVCTVENVLKLSKEHWSKINYKINANADLHEAHLLKLDCSKAAAKLHWHGTWDNQMTFKSTVDWYKSYYEDKIINTIEDIQNYVSSAKKKGLEWSNG